MNENLRQSNNKPASPSKWDSLANLEGNEDYKLIKIGVTELGNIDVLYDKQLKEAADNFLNEKIMPISNKAIDELVEYSTHLSYDEETIRNELYSSAYDIKDLTSVERQTESILSRYGNIDTSSQGASYEWVNINGGCGKCESRFYIAPAKENIHKVIRKLAQTFSENDTQASFKYKLSTARHTKHCDRIIIYNGVGKKEEVEDGIRSVYETDPELFENTERSPVWIGDSSVPGVYFAPETPGYSYGSRAMDAVCYARSISDYLWSNMHTPSQQEYKGVMKVLIPSVMLQLGLFALKDGRDIHFSTKLADKSLGSFRIKVNGIGYQQSTNGLVISGDLRHSKHSSENREYEITYSGSREGKEALLDDFYYYHLNNDKQISGMTKRVF